MHSLLPFYFLLLCLPVVLIISLLTFFLALQPINSLELIKHHAAASVFAHHNLCCRVAAEFASIA